MAAENNIVNTGLRGVIVATTRISDVIGDEGKLIIRGYRISDLAESVCYEEITYLLLYERMPNQKELTTFKAQIAESRAIPDTLIEALKTRPKDALPMDILQSAVSMLAHHDKDVHQFDSHNAALRSAVRLIAKLPTIVAAWERIRNGLEPVAPNENLDHAADFLYMMKGETPDPETARFLDTALVLHAEHSFNASTFAARSIASTRAHMYAAVAGAVGALSGELHGGANTRVMNMLLSIGSVENVVSYVNEQLDAGKKIMGLGHAVYKVDDPRALILAPMAQKQGERFGEPQWYQISSELEKKAKAAFKERKNLDMIVNVDFYSASLYYTMGIPLDLFTPIFAISRISGWAAHYLEEFFAESAPKATLYRPKSQYEGDYCGPDECSFTPVDSR
jgi:citrate synthase